MKQLWSNYTFTIACIWDVWRYPFASNNCHWIPLLPVLRYNTMGLHVVTDQNQRDLRKLDTTWDGGSDQIKYNQDSVCPPGPCRNNSTERHFAKQTITVFPCLWLFPAGIQVSFITRINGKPLKRVWSTRNQQASAGVAEVCTLTFSFTAFCLGPHQEVSPPGRFVGHKSTLFVNPCTPCCQKCPAQVAQQQHPSPCRRYAFHEPLPREHTQTHRHNESLRLEIQTKIWLSTPKRQTHLQRSALSRKSDGLLPSRRWLLSLLRRVAFTSFEKEKKNK